MNLRWIRLAERQAGPALETRPRPEETVSLMRISDIRDTRIRNPEGEDLGDLTDIAIDRESGRIIYAVLSYGGILGFGEKHFAIPWEAVRTHPGERVFVVDVDKRTLESAPGFARDAMPREGDWSLVRTLPPEPAVQTIAGGWGGEPTGQWASEEVRAGPLSPARLSAADLQVSLRGLEYPAGKGDLISHAREHNAAADVIAVLERFSDRTYRSAADVGEEFGNVR
ncbi:PRC-barrel domain-containing protein [Methanoculleus bourgensis MS2]|uniref:PRC-barrel domain-containing protein n=1 Tax=Methanoculleus bourgensis (strain ATCC 43281 / DSM 3045 / OCM 15 / MS2) TaxID=1201294 RepID=I7J771_METBM|nr:PRC-barrel domain-containing protein [Methanoculleus bourgensis MS2]